jgi:hypothetical protein
VRTFPSAKPNTRNGWSGGHTRQVTALYRNHAMSIKITTINICNNDIILAVIITTQMSKYATATVPVEQTCCK